MTIERTTHLSGVTGLAGLQVEDAVMAHRVTANARTGRDGTTTVGAVTGDMLLPGA